MPISRPALSARRGGVRLRPLLVSACALAGLLALGAPATASAADPVAAFEAYTGTPLVFERVALPTGSAYYERMVPLSAERRAAAARILLAEARKYPAGYLGDMGLAAVGVFEACVSSRGDGFRPFDQRHQGYLYYGLWNARDAVVACYYTDHQLPLTFHHEVFHHVDGTRDGRTDRNRFFSADDDRFARAISLEAPYPALRLSRADLDALSRRATGHVLRDAVGDYAAKNPGEDQAETARWLMAHLPDALLQAARQPELPGSQRILHVLAQYQLATRGGPGVAWFVGAALGRVHAPPVAQARPAPRRPARSPARAAAHPGVDRLLALAARPPAPRDAPWTHEVRQILDDLLSGPIQRLAPATRAQVLEAALTLAPHLVRARTQARDGDTAFTVWVDRDAAGEGNPVLRRDVLTFAADAARLARLADAAPGADREPVVRAQLQVLRLLARYYRYIADRWSVSPSTLTAFEDARSAIAQSLPAGHADLAQRVARAPLVALGDHITADGGARIPNVRPARPTTPVSPVNPAPPRPSTPATPARHNPHLAKVDAAISDRAIRAAIRAVQPATVGLSGGSGVNLRADGLILTNAHVVKQLNSRYQVRFPDGATYPGVTVAIDARLDLALVRLEGARGLPTAAVARAAPSVGDFVAVIGQPGTRTPEGGATGYQPWHVSTGALRFFHEDRTGSQSLGGAAHSAWTYWGHSGSPLFDRAGAIVALHNSWNPRTATRHAVTWEAIVQFLRGEGVLR